VADVQLADPQGVQATVNLGNGSTVPGTVAAESGGKFSIAADLAYHLSGNYPLTVTVTSANGVRALFPGTVHVTPGPNENYVSQLYYDLLPRGPDRGGHPYWATSPDNVR